MGRAPCCDKAKVKKGPWSPEEDEKLKDYMHTFGTACNWIALPQKAGLKRCGKSCRLRWLNYLRPNIKHGEFSDEEDRLILSLFSTIGSRWSIIAAQLPGRTDNDIKNYWNTKLKKKLIMDMSNNHKFPHLLPQKMKPNTTYHHQMLLHNSPRSQSPLLLSPAVSSTSPYNTTGANYYNTPSSSTLSFTGFDQSTTHGLLQQMQSSNYLVFGGAPEPSCSSSDGSFYTTKHHHQHDHMCAANSGDEQGIKFDQKCSYFYNGSSSVVEDDDQKNINSDSLIWENTPSPLMDYDGLEEIKQLISSTTTTTTSNSFYFDENKAGERGMMYY